MNKSNSSGKHKDASARKNRDNKKALVKPEVVEAEKALAQRYLDRKPLIKTTVKTNGGTISFEHSTPELGAAALEEAIGTQEEGFFECFINQVCNAACSGKEVEEEKINFMLAVIKGIKPRDQVEAMLGAQMAAIQLATMTFTRRLSNVDTLSQQDGAQKALNKLMRTFMLQMEALRKYRTGGQQTVTVQHVQVNEGGQAVVGNISHNKAQGAGG